jgi:hypothetical protein
VTTTKTAQINPGKMSAPPSAYKDRQFLAVIGDEVRIIYHQSQEAIAHIKDRIQ